MKVKTFKEKMKSRSFKKAIEKIRNEEIDLNCTHCGAILSFSTRTGQVESSFGPVTMEDPKLPQEYVFTISSKKNKKK